MSAPPAPAANPHGPTVLEGLRAAPSAAAMVLALSFFGFGAFARDLGLEAWQLAAMAVSTWALPSLVIFVVSMAAGAGPLAAAFAVTVSALRLLPMTIALMPYLSTEGLKRRWLFLATHFVAVTSYVEGLARLPAMAPERRTSWFIGFCAGVMLLAVTSSVVGYHVAGANNNPIDDRIVIITPIKFKIVRHTNPHSTTDLISL